MGRTSSVLVLALILASQVVSTDSWPAPVIKEVFSESRDWFVRVTPGKIDGHLQPPRGGGIKVIDERKS